DIERVAHLHAGVTAHVEDQSVTAYVSHETRNFSPIRGESVSLLIELVADRIHGRRDGFTQDRRPKVLATHVERTAAAAASSAACAYQRSARAFGLPAAGNCGQDLRRAGVHHSGRDVADRLGVALLYTAESKASQTVTAASDGGALIVAAKLSYGA